MKDEVLYLFEHDQSFRRSVAWALVHDHDCRGIIIDGLSEGLEAEEDDRRAAKYWNKAVSIVVLTIGMFAKDLIEWWFKR